MTAFPRFSMNRVRSRSGVILLIMLGLLATFTLIAATFVVSAGHFRRGATAASKAEQTGDPVETLLQQALMQVVRGSNHPLSAIGPHSLLEDLYGNADSVAGMVVENAVLDSASNAVVPAASIFQRFLPNVVLTSVSDATALSPSHIPRMVVNFQANDLTTITQTAPNSAPMLLELSAVGFGWDKKPGLANYDDDRNGVIDDVSETMWAGSATDDMLLGSTYAHPMQVGVPSPNWSQVWASKIVDPSANPQQPLPILDNVDNYYAGRVITFLSGDAAGKSTVIVRSKVVPLDPSNAVLGFPCVTLLWCDPIAGNLRPATTDRFVINGKPFSGTGLGSNPYRNNFPNPPNAAKPITLTVPGISTTGSNTTLVIANPALRSLDMPYVNPIDRNRNLDLLHAVPGGVPLALLPNPTDPGIREYLRAADSMVEADEDYDAPDVHNMMLAGQMWNPVRNRYEVVAPSLHRPDLVHHFLRNFKGTAGKRWTDLDPHVRRRLILRPEPADHFDHTQDVALDPRLAPWTPPEQFDDTNRNQQWDPGETYVDANSNGTYDTGDPAFANPGFDAILGPWDVDNDNNGEMDSVWVDLGMPVTTMADGRFVKPLFAVLCLDLDGRLNVNAHGSPAHYGVESAALQSYSGVQTPFNTPANSTEERIYLGSQAFSSITNVTSTAPKNEFTDPIVNKITPRGDEFYATGYVNDAPGSYTRLANTWMDVAVGQGYSPTDVNLSAFFARERGWMPRVPSGNPVPPSFPRLNSYRHLLEGVTGNVDYGAATTSLGNAQSQGQNGFRMPIAGRYGEPHMVLAMAADPVIAPTVPIPYPGTGSVPRAGISRILPQDAATFAQYRVGISGRTEANNSGNVNISTTNADVNLAAPADDDIPQSPAPKRNGPWALFGNSFRDDLTTNPTGTNLTINVSTGAFGTPGDFNSDGFIALNVAGQPIYKYMGTPDESVDEPTEINLFRGYSPMVNVFGQGGSPLQTSLASAAGNRMPMRTPVDANYSPAEFAHLLMSFDAARNGLPTRLSRNMTTHDSNGSEAAQSLVTSESWDIPCPHIVPTPELSRALRELGLPVSNPSLGDLLRARFYLAHGSYAAPGAITLHEVTQLANLSMRSYRWRTGTGGPDLDVDESPSPPPESMSAAAKQLLPHFPFGKRLTQFGLARQNLRMVSSDLILGLKMDVNAPFGNNLDDDGDGVVDEPTEWSDYVTLLINPSVRNLMYPSLGVGGYFGLASQPLWGQETTSNGAVRRFANPTPFDGNNDGNYHRFLDEMPRQQFAKNLFCLMMLLLDEQYVMPLESPRTNGIQPFPNPPQPPVMPASTPPIPTTVAAGVYSRTKTVDSWLTARRIAQWAINVVDFRDRDSIMTPFEFDVDPFYDNDLDTNIVNGTMTLAVERPMNTNGTWDVDGLVIDDPSAATADSTEVWRGVVWGCEYPDLILTETLAFHDRRTANTNKDTTGWGSGSRDPLRTEGYSLNPITGTEVPDPDWDQVRMPQGTAMFELYATGNAHLTFTPPKVTQTQSALPRELYTPDGRLDLSRVAIGYDLNTAQTQTVLKANPVWRLAISAARDMTLESPTTYDRQDVAATLARYPSICSLDPVNGNFGSLTQTQPTFSLLPPGVTMTTPLEAPRISRVVAMCTSILNFNATTTIQVNAIPEPVFATTQTNPVDVFFHQAARGTPVYASPGDYVVVGPYRQATDSAGNPDTSDTAFHNITTLGRTMRSMVTVTTGGTGQLESYSYPHPVIDLGVPILPTTSATGWQTREDRSFVVTSVNGVDEYPAVLARDLKAVFSSTDFVRGTSSLTNLVIPSSGAQATMTDQVTLAQIRRPITIACAITDTRSETIFGVATGSANNGRPIGLNISEPLVNLTTNLAQRLVSHRALYRNYSTVTSRTTTSDGWLSGLFWQDTWQLAPSAPTTGSIGPFADHPFDGSSTGAPPVPALPEQPLYDMGTVRNHEFLELGLGAASLANNNPLLDATYLRAKNVFLQRLADPTRVWHKDVNPYITLDWMPIDLTIFNGEPNQEGTETAGRLPDPDNPVQSYYDVLNAAPPNANTPMRPLAHLDRRVRFGSRQRGSPSFPFRRTRAAALGNTFTPLANSVNSYFDLWTQPNWLDERWDWDSRPSLTLRVFSADGSVAGKPNLRARYDVKASVKWQHPLQHTLGYLNQGYHAFRSIEKPPGRRAPDPTANVNFEHREIHPFVRPPGNRSTSPSNPSSSLTASPGDLGWYNVWNGSQPDVADVQYLGCPRRPFNWLNWNNRPYASALELMQVPAVGPTRLLFEYDMRRTALASDPGGGNVTTTGSIGPVPYDAHRSANPYLPYLPSAKVNTSSDLVGGYVNAPPFKHLLNFFGSTPAGANPLDMPHVDRKVYAGTVARPESMAGETTNATLPPRFTRLDLWQPNLYRVFEFLTVPTRFSGAVKQHLHGTLAFGGTNARAGLWNTAAEPMTPTIAGAENPLVPTSSPIRVHLSGRFEHPGWPFTAPYNTIPRYREPGRMNVNTIPVAQNAGQSQVPNIENYYATGDYGAAVWRGAINGFYPMMRAGNKLSSGNRGIDFLGSRGLSAPAPPTIVRWDHPCQDYIDNFYGLFAGMRSDARQYDIRGPNGLWQNGSWAASGNPDDKTALPNMSIAQTPATERLDPRRPSWVTNPVRTYLEDFTATIPPVAFPNAPPAPISARETPAPIRTTLPEAFRSSDVAASGTDGWETMLAVDSTLLRRRDTTWRPWNAVLDPATGNIGFNPQTAIHADPAFDPLFALNFPRPVPYVNMNPPAGPGSFFPGVTGYTMAMADNDPYASGPLPGINGATNQYCLKTTDYRNTDRNPFFRYQLFTKLGSVTTTRSNVYAIWVTCGFFECERMDPNAAIQSQEGTGLNDFSNAQRFPDGFRIVRELGSESGDIRRHRIFGIFDRSIPVGFERGENHNVDRAFLFRQILN